MTETIAQRNLRSRARPPWQDELARLRWFETQVGRQAATWRDEARGMREKITGFADDEERARLDYCAEHLEDAAATLEWLAASSHAGPDAGASDLEWAQWHADQLGIHLRYVVAAGIAGETPRL